MALFLAASGCCLLIPADTLHAQGGAKKPRLGITAPKPTHTGLDLRTEWVRAQFEGSVAGARGRRAAVRSAPGRARKSPVNWGERAAGGPAGLLDPRVDLSAAHALVREFSVDSAFATSDAALASALDDDRSLTHSGLPKALDRYAAQLSDVQVLQAGPAAIGSAEIRMVGQVAVIRPGHGSIALPPQTRVVAVDLRNLPAIDELEAILPRMVAPAMKEPVPQPPRVVRTHDGPVDEVLIENSVYSTGVTVEQPAPLPATGERDLPIVLLTGRRIAPQAAAFAAALRAARRAWIAGESVPLSVAESSWRGVGDRGLAVRTSMMVNVTGPAPEVLTGRLPVPGSSFEYNFTVSGTDTTSLDISLDGPDGADLDLYLLYDVNGNGVIEYDGPEFVAWSLTASPDETVRLAPVRPGLYQVVVYGFSVPAGGAPFTLSVRRTVVAPLPDEIPADLPVKLAGLPDYLRLAQQVSGVTPPPVSGAALRTAPAAIDPFGTQHPVANGRGELRAGLLIAHGVVRLFYRYFPVVGDTIDERLLETLAAANAHDGVDRIAFWRILRRFGEALRDGHQFVFSNVRLADTVLPLWLEHVDGRPVVRRSRVADIHPGDTIVALEGRPIEEVYAEELARTSAATPGYRLDIADRYIYRMSSPLTLTLQDPTGLRRTVIAAPQPISDYFDVVDRGVSDRPSGPLTDLGAPSLYYLNLHYFTTPTTAAARGAIAQASTLGSTGMVVDMRGYPDVDPYEVASRLIRQPFLSPVFEWTVFRGPEQQGFSTAQFPLFPFGAPAFSGPIVLLTGPHAVSASETFMQLLVGGQRLQAVVGQRSAGTNGSMTGVALPGGFRFTYTGMEVRNPDGSRHHGVGIIPDVEVPLTVPDLRDGIDRDLLTAIGLLH
jgi:hypothetical protein